MTEPVDAKFAPTHEWVRIEGEEILVGVSDYIQHRLADIIHVELPEPDDDHYEKGEDFIVIESLDEAMDFHAPLAGVVTSVNSELHSKPELINEDPYGAGWLVRMRPDAPVDFTHFMDYHEYDAGLPPEHDEEG